MSGTRCDCEYIPSSDEGRERHLEYHEGKRPFYCDHDCGDALTQYIDMVDHCFAVYHQPPQLFSKKALSRQSVRVQDEATTGGSSRLTGASLSIIQSIPPPSECNCLLIPGHPGAAERHKLYHLGIRPWKCDKCGEALVTKARLDAHLVNMHGLYQKLVHFRPHCGSHFQYEATRNVHLEQKLCVRHGPTKGSSLRPPMSFGERCDCVVVPHKKEGRKRHEAYHEGTREYKCSRCNDAFTHDYRLRTHVLQFHENDDKPFGCSHCGFCFKQEGEKIIHEHKGNCRQWPGVPEEATTTAVQEDPEEMETDLGEQTEVEADSASSPSDPGHPLLVEAQHHAWYHFGIYQSVSGAAVVGRNESVYNLYVLRPRYRGPHGVFGSLGLLYM